MFIVVCNPVIPYHVDKHKISELSSLSADTTNDMTLAQKGFMQMLKNEQQSKQCHSSSLLHQSQDSVMTTSATGTPDNHNHVKHCSCECECFHCLLCHQKTKQGQNNNIGEPIEVDEFLKQYYPDILKQYISLVGKSNFDMNKSQSQQNILNGSAKKNLSTDKLPSNAYLQNSPSRSKTSVYSNTSYNKSPSHSSSTQQRSVESSHSSYQLPPTTPPLPPTLTSKLDRFEKLSNKSHYTSNNNNSNSSNNYQYPSTNHQSAGNNHPKVSVTEDPPLLTIPTITTPSISHAESTNNNSSSSSSGSSSIFSILSGTIRRNSFEGNEVSSVVTSASTSTTVPLINKIVGAPYQQPPPK